MTYGYRSPEGEPSGCHAECGVARKDAAVNNSGMTTGRPAGYSAISNYSRVEILHLVQDRPDRTVAELVAFLEWMGEPAQNDRIRLGVWVLIFLGVFTVIAWRLNAAYWKDVK